MKKIIVSLAMGAMLSSFPPAGVCGSPGAFLPKEVSKLSLEMTSAELNKVFPGAKKLFEDPGPTMYFIDINNDPIWVAAACCYKNGAMDYLGLLTVDTSENGVKERKNKTFNDIENVICLLISDISENSGKIDEKYISEEKGDRTYYNAVLVWKTETCDVHLEFTPPKYVFDVKTPCITLAITPPGADITSHYPKLLRENGKKVKPDGEISESVLFDEIVRFDDVVSEKIKNSIRKNKAY